ncbi:MAG: VWA domain-containing protein [Methanosphaera sp.]|nr:VWA domain-containing protein [Methanosphaera sp.]
MITITYDNYDDKLLNNKIVTLSNFLRKEGMYVSIRSSVTASWIINNLNTTNSELKQALKCVYVKNKEDERKFDYVFDRIFKQNKNMPNKIDNSTIETINDNENINSTSNPNQTEQEHVEENRRLINQRQQEKVINDKLTATSIDFLNNYDQRVFDICQRLSKKLANQRSKRRKRHNSHNINMQRTIRNNLKNGGHLIHLEHQKPPRRKTKQIFLSDVSGSCEWASTWFFAILYGCYKTFDKVTLYDFDNKLTDVTDTLGSQFKNTNEINIAHQELGIRPHEQSDMNNSFRQFLDEAQLNNHTDVIILTDCRDWKGQFVDGKLESALLLEKIVQRSRRVLILNPEKKIRWNTPTSHVRDYQLSGASVFETCNLQQFADVIAKL